MGAHASKGGDDRRCIKEAQLLSGRERDGTDDSKPGKEWARHQPALEAGQQREPRLQHLQSCRLPAVLHCETEGREPAQPGQCQRQCRYAGAAQLAVHAEVQCVVAS
jgi:hypothetical protein